MEEMNELNKELAKAILTFLKRSRGEMKLRNVPTDELRIALPTYLTRFLADGLLQLHEHPAFGPVNYKNGYEKLLDIRVHPTWENAITLYYNDYPSSILNDVPIFKMSFDTEMEEYGLGKSVVTYVAKSYGYKL